MKKNIFLFFIFHFSFFNTNAQVNLVPNPSFEETISCSSWGIHSVFTWFTPTVGSPDIFKKCMIIPNYKTPNNNKGYQYPRTGDNYAGGVWGGGLRRIHFVNTCQLS